MQGEINGKKTNITEDSQYERENENNISNDHKQRQEVSENNFFKHTLIGSSVIALLLAIFTASNYYN